MRHSLPGSHQFYVTAPQPCPYLEGRVERKLFTALHGEDAEKLNETLSQQGFRRSQNVLYRPSCAGCGACLSARIVVEDMHFSRSQRRVLRRNDTLRRSVRNAWATEAQYDLFRRYLDSRHAAGGMADMDIFEYAAMVEETPVRSLVIEYYRPGPAGPSSDDLVAVCLTDALEDGLSMVYSFFDPDLPECSLGSFIILDHVRLARELALPYVYLGYWVPGSQKMDYKARFQPLEVFEGGRWHRLDNYDAAPQDIDHSGTLAVRDQVAAIELPRTR